MVRKRKAQDIAVTESSGNVFADLGLAEPEEELAKAQLASHIRHVLKRRRLTQTAAAKRMGIDQPKVSALLNGRLANFSSERLMRLLTALGHDVEITVSAESRSRSRGRLRVSAATYPIADSGSATPARGFSEVAPDLAIAGRGRSRRS